MDGECSGRKLELRQVFRQPSVGVKGREYAEREQKLETEGEP